MAGAQRESAGGEVSRRMPALFVAHGVPASLLDVEYGNALRRFSARQVSLDGIVVVSAHWESLRPIRVTRSEQLELLRDFGTMPSPVERVNYRCRGHLGLADRVVALLGGAGISAMAEPSRWYCTSFIRSARRQRFAVKPEKLGMQ
jgi:4,5-DOPA dioxygenase extradiol